MFSLNSLDLDNFTENKKLCKFLYSLHKTNLIKDLF